MSPTTSTPQAAIIQLSLDRLLAHPLNPRKKSSVGSLQTLVESLKARGQLEPILVRELEKPGEGKLFEILAGHRRVAALPLAGFETADAVLRLNCSDAEALAILIAANDEREDVDAFLEAEAVKQLVTFEGSVKGAAARLGQTPLWVAQRLSLLELSPTWAKRRKTEPWSSWTPAHWALLARLAPAAQEELATPSGSGSEQDILENEVPPLSELEWVVREKLRVIGKAPFDVTNGKLCKGVPACGDCPKTSQSVPGLFDDGTPQDLKTATCRDAFCWGRKAAAALKNAIADGKTLAAASVVGVTPFPADEVLVVSKGHNAPKAAKAIRSGDWKPATEKTKGAKPAVIVDEGGKVSTGFVTLLEYGQPIGTRQSSSSGAGSAPKQKTESLVEKLKRLEEMHQETCDREVEALVFQRIMKEPPSSYAHALAAILVIGARSSGYSKEPKGTKDRRLELAESLAAGETFIEEDFTNLVAKLIVDAVDDMKYDGFDGEPAEARRALEVAKRVSRVSAAEIEKAIAKTKVPPDLIAARKAAEVEASKWVGGKIGGELVNATGAKKAAGAPEAPPKKPKAGKKPKAAKPAKKATAKKKAAKS